MSKVINKHKKTREEISAYSVEKSSPDLKYVGPGSDEIIMARASWYYYLEGLTQSQIANKLGVHRTRVNRILAQARHRGIVQVRIESPVNLSAERAIEKCFELDQVVLVQTPSSRNLLPESIASATGGVLSERMKAGMSIGVGWGRTLRLSVRSVTRRHYNDISIVSLLGGLMRGSVMNTYETASHMADIYDAECFYIAAPAFADTADMAELFRHQSSVKDAINRASSVDLALISVGALNQDSTMSRLGLIDSTEEVSLREMGAVGDLCAQWINMEGEVLNHPLNRRVVAMPVDSLNKVPTVLLASGGKEKVKVMYGALKKKCINVLVTDEETGLELLRLVKKSKE